MPTIEFISAVATEAPIFTDRMTAAANTVPVPRPLLRIMAAAGVTGPGDVDRLSTSQLDKMCENKTPGERIGIKQAVLAAGLYPRAMPTVSPITIGR